MAVGPDRVSESDQHGPVRRGPRGLLVGVGVLAVVVMLVVGLILLRAGDPGRSAKGPVARPTASASRSPTVSDVYRAVAPSVVVVRTKNGALGSGVIATSDGTVITANHVVEDGSPVTVTFYDGRQVPARVASGNAKTDIATLAPAGLPQTLVPATFGGAVQVGSSVVAIGNPLGLTDSVSSGVVSGVDRPATTDHGRFTGLIQFDAAVNPGSSGGPLLDAHGLVIGIVVSIADPGADDAFAGIGFAVPIGSILGGLGAGKEPQL